MPTESVKLCECGCGEPTEIAQWTRKRLGLVKGQPKRFLRGHHCRIEFGWVEEDQGYETPCRIWQGSLSGKRYLFLGTPADNSRHGGEATDFSR